jgi:hypothetical protein
VPIWTSWNWQRLKHVVRSLTRSPEDREAYVVEACAGDGTLKAEVELLIAA